MVNVKNISVLTLIVSIVTLAIMMAYVVIPKYSAPTLLSPEDTSSVSYACPSVNSDLVSGKGFASVNLGEIYLIGSSEFDGGRDLYREAREKCKSLADLKGRKYLDGASSARAMALAECNTLPVFGCANPCSPRANPANCIVFQEDFEVQNDFFLEQGFGGKSVNCYGNFLATAIGLTQKICAEQRSTRG